MTLLQDEGITHVLSVGAGLPKPFPALFKYHTIDILDKADVNIVEFFPMAFAFLEDALEEGKVFIHCFAGRSRSTSVLCAFLMAKEGLSFDVRRGEEVGAVSDSCQQSLSLVRMCRPVAQPNEGFSRQLRVRQAHVGGACMTVAGV